jgi:hypothetical protein
MKWDLRLTAANAGIWKANEMQRLLAEHGLVISAGKMSNPVVRAAHQHLDPGPAKRQRIPAFGHQFIARCSTPPAQRCSKACRLDVLDPQEALRLLARIAGPVRTDAESDAAAIVCVHCGHLPLAVRAWPSQVHR